MTTLRADALRGSIQDLDNAIDYARICIRKGDKRTSEFVAEYISLVRRVYELQIARQAESNIVLAICGPFLPKPFGGQIMDSDPVRKFRREWAGFCSPKIHHAPRLSRAA